MPRGKNMKCHICDSILQRTENQKILYCSHCDMLVHMENRQVRFGKKAPKYYTESMEVLHAIISSHPDMVIGARQLFSLEFNKEDVTFFYTNKNNFDSYSVPMQKVYYGMPYKLPDNFTLIYFKGLLSYSFRSMLENTVSAVAESKKVPVIKLSDCTPERYMWQLMVACSCNEDENSMLTAREFVNHLCVPAFCAVPEDYSDEAMILYLALNDRLRHYALPYNKATAVYDITNWKAQLINAMSMWFDGIESYNSVMDERIKNIPNYSDEQLGLLKDTMFAYALTRPALRQFIMDRDNFTLLNPEYFGFIDDIMFRNYSKEYSGSNLYATLAKFELYKNILDAKTSSFTVSTTPGVDNATLKAYYTYIYKV